MASVEVFVPQRCDDKQPNVVLICATLQTYWDSFFLMSLGGLIDSSGTCACFCETARELTVQFMLGQSGVTQILDAVRRCRREIKETISSVSKVGYFPRRQTLDYCLKINRQSQWSHLWVSPRMTQQEQNYRLSYTEQQKQSGSGVNLIIACSW